MTTGSGVVRHWKREGADVYIGRPGPWGNPFEIGIHGDRAAVVERYRAWLAAQPHLQRLARRELREKTLGCWCAPQACHGDVLAAVAQSTGPRESCFVFGSNFAGVHGAGAALFAKRWRSAQVGVGTGFTGQAYAIPTKDHALKPLPLATVSSGIARFLDDAADHADTVFEVTRVGCGLAGWQDSDVTPLFMDAPANVDLPYRWQRMRDPALPPRVIVAGSRGFDDLENLNASLDRILSRMPDAVIVSGAAEGPDTLGEHYALARWPDRDVPFMRYPAEWDRYGKAAGFIRNQQMAWGASHLVAFWDGRSPGTKSMIGLAAQDGLLTRVVHIGVRSDTDKAGLVRP
ncbi:DUF4326 domain-containing protein [Rhodanobacter sp. B2A1Ga4]|uniref:A1S_2505 family phage non-structural protein n=1 Tax=Rhodanobacter sp. B2A1Ga4 TaxID=2778647 RepID=UPI001B3786FC